METTYVSISVELRINEFRCTVIWKKVRIGIGEIGFNIVYIHCACGTRITHQGKYFTPKETVSVLLVSIANTFSSRQYASGGATRIIGYLGKYIHSSSFEYFTGSDLTLLLCPIRNTIGRDNLRIYCGLTPGIAKTGKKSCGFRSVNTILNNDRQD